MLAVAAAPFALTTCERVRFGRADVLIGRWHGVVARTIQDWLAKPLRPKREAESS
jgi:hypothetical protein